MKELTELLKELANKLGTTVEHLYAVLVKQARIEALRIGFRSLLHPVVCYALWRFILFAYDKSQIAPTGGYYGLTDSAWGWWFAIVPAAVVVIYLVYDLLDNAATVITCLKNPEYFALTQIFEQFGNSD